MKKLILSLVMVAFAVAVQAGDDAKSCPDKDKAACCAKMKAGDQAKAQCPMNKEAKATCPYADKADKACCNKDMAQKDAQKQALNSPKASGN